MFTRQEALLRNRENRVHMSRRDGEYRVTLLEYHGTDRGEDIAYYTDDLEDAVLTGAAMRRLEDQIKRG